VPWALGVKKLNLADADSSENTKETPHGDYVFGLDVHKRQRPIMEVGLPDIFLSVVGSGPRFEDLRHVMVNQAVGQPACWNRVEQMGELSAIVGFVAGLVTAAANLPQVWKTYRNKSGEGLSFRMLLALAIGLGLWIIYGIMIKSLPLIATNVVVFLLILSLIGMKLKFDRAPTKDWRDKCRASAATTGVSTSESIRGETQSFGVPFNLNRRLRPTPPGSVQHVSLPIQPGAFSPKGVWSQSVHRGLVRVCRGYPLNCVCFQVSQRFQSFINTELERTKNCSHLRFNHVYRGMMVFFVYGMAVLVEERRPQAFGSHIFSQANHIGINVVVHSTCFLRLALFKMWLLSNRFQVPGFAGLHYQHE
jgi:MtN3 and saliva related transmembrane protein